MGFYENGEVIDENDVVAVSTGVPDAGKGVRLGPDGKLDLSFYRFAKGFTTYEPINGSSTPKLVSIHSGGTILLGSTATARQATIGFAKDDYSTFLRPNFLNAQSNTNNSGFSVTANAGNNRVIVFFTRGAGTGAAAPTVVSWNGQNFTQLGTTVTAGSINGSCWILPIGSSGSSQTFSLTMTGAGGSTSRYDYLVYENVNQTTPGINFDRNAVASDVNCGTSSPSSLPYTKYLFGGTSGGPNVTITTPSGATYRLGPAQASFADFDQTGNLTVNIGTASASPLVVFALALNPSVLGVDITVEVDGIVEGFSGLSVGSKYYAQTALGTIGTTPGSPSILVGKAVSATELLIIQS